MPIVAVYTNFLENFPREWRKVELHEKCLVITLWRRQVRKSMIAHFVAVIIYLFGLCRNKCQLTDFIQIFYRVFKKSEEKVELHEKRMIIIFWRRRVRKSMLVHFFAVVMYLLSLCRNNANCWILFKFFREFSKRVNKKSNFMKNFVNNFLKKTS